MRRHVLRCLALFSLALLWALPARGDPITLLINAGSADFDPNVSMGITGMPFQLFGSNGLSLILSAGDGIAGPKAPLEPGQTAHISGSWVGNDLAGTATYAGETYTGIGGLLTANEASLTFMSSDFIVPALGSSTASVLAPFTLNGTFQGTPGDGLSEIPTLTARLIGSGIGRLPLTYDSSVNAWTPGIVHLDVSTPAPVPEPTTLLLLGLGVIGAYGGTRRSRRTAH